MLLPQAQDLGLTGVTATRFAVALAALTMLIGPIAAKGLDKLIERLHASPDRCVLVGAYALGKAQRVIAELRERGHDAPIYIHGALQRLCDLYADLGVALGEKITLMAPQGQVTPAGVIPRLKQFTVAGIFEVGFNEADAALALVHLEDAQQVGDEPRESLAGQVVATEALPASIEVEVHPEGEDAVVAGRDDDVPDDERAGRAPAE